MPKLRDDDWLFSSKGEKRGYIQPQGLQELWFHTGTSCNLCCHFCLEGSGPGDQRLQLITPADAKPFIDEAVELGVSRFSFTGGEPFVNPQLIAILDYALNFKPCQVLTNGTAPLHRQFDQLLGLGSKPNGLSFRISLDYPDPGKHDAARGRGNFARALESLGWLYRQGFGVSIARKMQADEDSSAVDMAYAAFFLEVGVPSDIPIIKFPEFHRPGSIPPVPEVTETCMTKYLSAAQREEFMCNFSKMIVKQNDLCGVYSCTLVDDDADYLLGRSLKEAMTERIMLKHHRCYACFAFGASCSEAG